jgi:hypothetical protein
MTATAAALAARVASRSSQARISGIASLLFVVLSLVASGMARLPEIRK